MNTNFKPLVSKILISMAIVALVLIQVGTPVVSAQSGLSTNITSYDQIPEKGQLVIPAGTGFKAPALMHGLVATIWYGGKDDTTNSFVSFSGGIAKDRVAKYGGVSSDYPTVVWTGASDTITGTQNCRDGFYSDSVVITEGVVYGDRCPLMIEYHLEHFVPAIADVTATAIVPAPTQVLSLTPTPTVTPTSTPTAPAEVTSTPSATAMQPTATVDPLVIPISGEVNKLNLMGWIIGALVLAVLFLAFRRPSAPVVAPVAPKAAAPRRKKTAPKKKSAEK